MEEKKVDSFNIPVYTPSLTEVKSIVLNEGRFRIDRLEVSKINWNVFEDRNDQYNCDIIESNIAVDKDYNYAKCMRSVVESLLVRHFGQSIIHELFIRYEQIIKDYMLKEEIGNINLTIS